MSSIPNLADLIEGLHERFRTIDKLNAVLLGVPSTIDPPVLYTLVSSGEFRDKGQVKTHDHKVVHRVCIRWQDGEQAELEILDFIELVPRSVEADPQLNGRIRRGQAAITRYDAGFDQIGGVTYRAVDFFSDVLVKGRKTDGRHTT